MLLLLKWNLSENIKSYFGICLAGSTEFRDKKSYMIIRILLLSIIYYKYTIAKHMDMKFLVPQASCKIKPIYVKFSVINYNTNAEGSNFIYHQGEGKFKKFLQINHVING